MKILVTGGAGYIGSTTCSALSDNNHEIIILDSLVKGRKEFTEKYIFYEGDISDLTLLKKIFMENPDIDICLHFAALIIAPESVLNPYLYYTENVVKSLELFKNLKKVGCKKIILSSSASLYDLTENFMVKEDSPLKPSSPYARSKYMTELILEDFCTTYGFKGLAFRYFNPIGADIKMRSGPYDPNPTNVLGKILNVAFGKDKIFNITGVNWPTRDGLGMRDYIHVWDLAKAHVLGVEKFEEVFNLEKKDYSVINLGSGKGVTVKELLLAFESVWGKRINKREALPRLGDIAGAYANSDKAKKLLNWKAELPLEKGIKDLLQWMEYFKKNKKFKDIK